MVSGIKLLTQHKAHINNAAASLQQAVMPQMLQSPKSWHLCPAGHARGGWHG